MIKLITDAKRLIFLGFGFDKFNLEILGFPDILLPKHDVYWTQYKLKTRKLEVVDKLFRSELIPPYRVSVDGKSIDLIDQIIF